MEPIRWGILGTGSIAAQFATGLRDTPDAVLAAVGSRHQPTADAFAARFGNPVAYGSYEDLAADPSLDIIYIATPHPLHYSCAKLVLEAGKGALVEKPFTLNAAEAADLIAYSRQHNRFLMEAMWSRFLPTSVTFRKLVDDGAIGEPGFLFADFGFRMDPIDPNHRLFNPALGGGALLDVGIYVTSLASWIFGTPETIVSHAQIGETGVDEQNAIVLGYPGGAIAQLASATRTNMPQAASLIGTEGTLRLESPWWNPRKLTLAKTRQPDQHFEPETTGNGYNYEAAEAGACLRAGKIESSVISLDETLATMQTLDTIRGQWGLRYPGERDGGS